MSTTIERFDLQYPVGFPEFHSYRPIDHYKEADDLCVVSFNDIGSFKLPLDYKSYEMIEKLRIEDGQQKGYYLNLNNQIYILLRREVPAYINMRFYDSNTSQDERYRIINVLCDYYDLNIGSVSEKAFENSFVVNAHYDEIKCIHEESLSCKKEDVSLYKNLSLRLQICKQYYFSMIEEIDTLVKCPNFCEDFSKKQQKTIRITTDIPKEFEKCDKGINPVVRSLPKYDRDEQMELINEFIRKETEKLREGIINKLKLREETNNNNDDSYDEILEDEEIHVSSDDQKEKSKEDLNSN